MQSTAKKRRTSPLLKIIRKAVARGTHPRRPRKAKHAHRRTGARSSRKKSRKKMAGRVDPAHKKHPPARAPTSLFRFVMLGPKHANDHEREGARTSGVTH
jgi:hypothetical protein